MSGSTTERKSLSVMACTLVSRLLGVVKAMVLADVFGSGATGDLINFVYNIPNAFRKQFSEGVLSTAYIPFISKKGARRTLDSLLSYQLLLFAALVLLSLFQGEEIVSLLSDFSAEQVALGGSLLPFFMLFLLFLFLSSATSSLLQTKGRFFLPAAAPLIYSVVVIVWVSKMKTPAALAQAVATGGALQFIITCIPLLKAGYRPHFTLSVPDRAIAAGWAGGMLASVVLVVAQQLLLSLASTLNEGSITAYTNAQIFWLTPYGIVFNSLSAVFFPLFARSAEPDELKQHIETSQIHLISLLVPAAIILYTLSCPVVFSLLQRGNYSAECAYLTAKLVRISLFGMVLFALDNMLLKVLYATGRHRAGLCAVLVQSALTLLFTALLIESGMDVVSLPLAFLLCSAVMFGLYTLLIRKKTGWWGTVKSLHKMKKVAVANIPLLGFAIFYTAIGPEFWTTGSNIRNILYTAIWGIAGCSITLITYIKVEIPFLKRLRS